MTKAHDIDAVSAVFGDVSHLPKREVIFLTLCFYEHPVAQSHIDFWEKSMREMSDRTLEKTEFSDSLYYVLKKTCNKKEILYCIRLNNIPKFSYLVDNIIFLLEKNEAIVYNKTLVFGKVTERDLKQISIFSEKLKNLKVIL